MFTKSPIALIPYLDENLPQYKQLSFKYPTDKIIYFVPTPDVLAAIDSLHTHEKSLLTIKKGYITTNYQKQTKIIVSNREEYNRQLSRMKRVDQYYYDLQNIKANSTPGKVISLSRNTENTKPESRVLKPIEQNILGVSSANAAKGKRKLSVPAAEQPQKKHCSTFFGNNQRPTMPGAQTEGDLFMDMVFKPEAFI